MVPESFPLGQDKLDSGLAGLGRDHYTVKDVEVVDSGPVLGFC